MFWFVLAILLCAVELGIKAWVRRSLSDTEDKDILNNKVTLTKRSNEGLAMGLFKGNPRKVLGLTLIGLGVVLGLFYMATGKKGNFLMKAGATLALGGAMSNAYERIMDGSVTDYFKINLFKNKKGRIVFNIADYMIFCGTLLALVSRKSK